MVLVDNWEKILKPHEMPFTEFVNAMQPTGAVNRLPRIGAGDDVLTYSVYMNGPLASALPEDARDHHYKDVMLHALTEKLGLNSESWRDNMKVAEIVAVRSSWMSAVLEATMGRGEDAVVLRDDVVRDYEALTKGLSHPWLKEQVQLQQQLSRKLTPVLRDAESVAHGALNERAPDTVNKGVVLSQSLDFTVQAVGNGDVVAHENQKLGAVPPVGADVVVSYYRGQGQVFPNMKDLDVSPPFIDPKSNHLGVLISDKAGEHEQMVLFNNIKEFEKFVGAQGLPYALVNDALKLKDVKSMAPAVENPLEKEANAVEKLMARVMNSAQALGIRLDQDKVSALLEEGKQADGLFVGKVVSVDERLGLVYQSQGMGKGVVLRADSLSKVPNVGDVATITMKNGRGGVVVGERNESRGR